MFANHIHVTLQNDDGFVFVACGCWFTDDDVTGFINMSVKTTALAKRFQVLNHLFFLLGRTGNRIDFRELLEYASRFKFTICHFINLFIWGLFSFLLIVLLVVF